MTSPACECNVARRTDPKTRERSILGSTRGPRVGFGGSPKQSFLSGKFAKAGRFRQHASRVCSPEMLLSARPAVIASRYGELVGETAGTGAGVPKLKFTAGALSAPGCAAKNGRGAKPNIPAIKFVGKLRTVVL